MYIAGLVRVKSKPLKHAEQDCSPLFCNKQVKVERHNEKPATEQTITRLPDHQNWRLEKCANRGPRYPYTLYMGQETEALFRTRKIGVQTVPG